MALCRAYCQEPYDSFVSGVTAQTASGAVLSVAKDVNGGPRWVVSGIRDAASDFPVTVSYSVDVAAQEKGLSASGDASKYRTAPDPNYVGLLLISVAGYVDSLQDAPIQLSVNAPGTPLSLTVMRRAPLLHCRCLCGPLTSAIVSCACVCMCLCASVYVRGCLRIRVLLPVRNTKR